MPTTVAEAREIMGSDSDKFSDKEIENMIRNTNLLADIVVRHAQEVLLNKKNSIKI